MPNPFSNKKLLKELQEQRDLLFAKQQQEDEAQRWKEEQQRQLQEAQRWKERQLHDQLMQAERQLEQERQVREQERQNLARHREKERRDRERLEKEREKKEREQRRLERLKVTSPEALRGLRDLIRTRYALDMEIWSLRGVKRPDRPIVEERMGKADAVLEEIYNMVATWEENSKVWTPQEWELARDIK